MDFNSLTPSAKQKEEFVRPTVGSALINMRFFATRMIKGYEHYEVHGDLSIEDQLIFDSIKSNLNDYVQAFLDIAVGLSSVDGHYFDTLRGAIKYYANYGEKLSTEGRNWLIFLQRRNDLVHEYYNLEFLNEELKKTLKDNLQGVMELVEALERSVAATDTAGLVIKK